jgi:uncharacterized protein
MATTHTNLPEKYQQLLDFCRAQDSLLVAYSGGIDSTLCAYAAHQALGKQARAVFFRTCLNTAEEMAEAQAIADKLAIPLTILELDPLIIPEVGMNTTERCYACKKALYTQAKQLANQLDLAHLADGGNSDDLAATNRPGSRAAAELQVVQPLAALEFSKADVRALAYELGLPNHNLPSRPCLATRFPYNTQLTPELLAQVAAGEQFLRRHLDGDFRLRIHGNIARIEAEPAAWPSILEQSANLLQSLRELGFTFVTLDLSGFQSGSFDKI